jgi:hypothetical protein
MPELDLLSALEQLDPTRADVPPAAGSARYHSIRETALALSGDDSDSQPSVRAFTSTRPASAGTRRRRTRLLSLAAAGLLIAIAAVIVFQPGDEPSPAAALTHAVENLSDITSMRATIEVEYPGGDGATSTLEMNGDDMQSIIAAGQSSESWTVVDGTEYLTRDGQTTVEPLNPNFVLDPFGQASAAVVTSVLAESPVTEIGTEMVRGVNATHYRLDIGDPSETGLARLPRATAEWFNLWSWVAEEGPDRAWDVSIDLWVSDDDLIRRIRVSADEPHRQAFTAEYFDFNADIVITAPSGPYSQPGASE